MRLSSNAVRASLNAHSGLGLFIAALLYLVCFTGVISVFYPDFERWEQPHINESFTVAPEIVQVALTLLLDFWWPTQFTAIFWASSLLIIIVSTAIKDQKKISFNLRVLLISLLLIILTTHVIRYGNHSFSGSSLLINVLGLVAIVC